MNILLIDDHQLFAESLVFVLTGMPEIDMVKTAVNPQGLLRDIAALTHYDLILVDLEMPGISGSSFLKALKTQNCDVRVAVLSGVEALAQIEQAMQLGARGFLPKSLTSAELQRAVRSILNGERFLPDEYAGRINLNLNESADSACSSYHPKVGPRQLEVLDLIKQGQANKEIALVLGVSESAVKAHVSILFGALGVKTRTACVQSAVEQGLLG